MRGLEERERKPDFGLQPLLPTYHHSHVRSSPPRPPPNSSRQVDTGGRLWGRIKTREEAKGFVRNQHFAKVLPSQLLVDGKSVDRSLPLIPSPSSSPACPCADSHQAPPPTLGPQFSPLCTNSLALAGRERVLGATLFRTTAAAAVYIASPPIPAGAFGASLSLGQLSQPSQPACVDGQPYPDETVTRVRCTCSLLHLPHLSFALASCHPPDSPSPSSSPRKEARRA